MNYILAILRNEKYIFEIICIIAFAIIFTRIINTFYKETGEQESNNKKNIYKDLSQEEIKSSKDIVDEFINLCINNKYTEAYELLSDECKNTIYQDENSFQKEYVQKYISKLETYRRNAIDYTDNKIICKVEYTPNSIETGLVEKNIDYITVEKKENGEQKLSLMGLIEANKIEKEYNSENIKIRINNKIIFYNYEEFEIEILNKSGVEIILYANTIMCSDEKDYNYYNDYENNAGKIKVNPYDKKIIKVKMNKKATEGRKN